MSNTTAQLDIEKLQAKHAMEMSVLQGRYLSSQMHSAASVRARHRAEAILQQYLLVLFPDLFARAIGAQMSITEAGEYLYAHHLYDSDPKEIFRVKNAQTEEEAASTSPTAPVVAEQGVDLSGDAVKFLYVLGMTVVANEARALWAQHTGRGGWQRETHLARVAGQGPAARGANPGATVSHRVRRRHLLHPHRTRAGRVPAALQQRTDHLRGRLRALQVSRSLVDDSGDQGHDPGRQCTSGQHPVHVHRL